MYEMKLPGAGTDDICMKYNCSMEGMVHKCMECSGLWKEDTDDEYIQ